MPLLWLSLAFVGGILLGQVLPLPWFVWGALAVLSVGSVWMEKSRLSASPRWSSFRKHVPLPPGVLLAFMMLGALRFTASQPVWDASDLAYYNDRGVYTFTAVVSAPPDRREDATYLEVDTVDLEDPLATDPAFVIRPIQGKARVRLSAGVNYKYGDLLLFTAEPLTPSDESDFSYKAFLSRQGIHTAIYHPRSIQVVGQGRVSPLLLGLEKLRQKARLVILRQFPQPESGLLEGILLGNDNDMPASLKGAYQSTGMTHIIAISGFNMAVLAGLVMLIFSRMFNRYWSALLASIVLVTYAIFVGGSPSVVRAAVMAVSAFGGHLIGRRQSGGNALGFTAAGMCAINPQLVGDISFQLSFAATLGLVLFASPLQAWAMALLKKRFSEEKVELVGPRLIEYTLFTLAAQVVTLPIIAIHFQRISLSSLLANPLVLPVQPALLTLGGFSTIAGLILPEAGRLLALLAWPLLKYTNFMVELLAKVRAARLTLHPAAVAWIAVFTILFLLLFLFRNYFMKLFKGKFVWVLFGLLLLAVSVWSMALHKPDGQMHLRVVRTGEESVLVLQTPQGQTLLLNPGKKENELSAAIGYDLSPWNFDIDEVWLTNRESGAELGALNERILVKKVILTAPVYVTGADDAPLVIPQGVEKSRLKTMELYTVEAGLTLTVVAEDGDSAALYLEYGSLRVLIPNGVDYALIHEQAPAALQTPTVLVLAPEDVSYIPPRVWTDLEPQVVLWNSPALSPDTSWMGADAYNRVEVVSDSTEYSLNLK